MNLLHDVFTTAVAVRSLNVLPTFLGLMALALYTPPASYLRTIAGAFSYSVLPSCSGSINVWFFCAWVRSWRVAGASTGLGVEPTVA